MDANRDPAVLSDQLDDIASAPFVAVEKQRSLELLDLAIGCSVLDVGCGNGPELKRLAKLVGPGGRVVGLDPSTALIAEAKARGLAGPRPIELLLGDAHSLPFEDAEFHACRADRTVQHLAQPDLALREMVRVTRSGGRVVVTESRWGLVAPSLDREVTDRVLQVVATDREREKWIGYRLASILGAAGLTEVHDISSDYTVGDEDDLFRFTSLRGSVETAVRAGAVTREQGDIWTDRLRDLIKRGDAFAVVIVLHVAGIKR